MKNRAKEEARQKMSFEQEEKVESSWQLAHRIGIGMAILIICYFLIF